MILNTRRLPHFTSKWVWLLLLSLLGTRAQAEDITKPSGVLQSISELQQKRHPESGYTSAFEQTLFSALRNKEKTSSGTLSFRGHDKFRWHILQPKEELYISNGKKLWKYNSSAKHAQSMPVDTAGLEFLQAIFDPSILSKRYNLAEWTQPTESGTQAKKLPSHPAALAFASLPADSEKLVLAKLTPKDASSQEKLLYLAADPKTGLVLELRIAFQNGNLNRLKFSRWVKKELKETDFNFNPPPGTAVDHM